LLDERRHVVALLRHETLLEAEELLGRNARRSERER
jgi:hypothetical protein